MIEEMKYFSLNDQKGLMQVLILILLVLGLIASLILIKNPKILSSRASEIKDKLNIFSGSDSQILELNYQKYKKFDLNNDGRVTLDEISKSGGVVTTGQHSGLIVQFKDEPLVKRKSKRDIQSVRNAHETAKSDVLSRLGSGRSIEGMSRTILKGDYQKVFNGIAIDVPDTKIADIQQSPYVKAIFPNYEMQAFLNDSVPLIKANEVWKLNIGSNKATGKGIKVGIIDTGIDYTHPDLGACTKEQFESKKCPKVIDGYNFLENNNNAVDDNGHGTHVAATVAGNGFLKGVAPDALLISYKVLNSNGQGGGSGIISAIEKAVDPNGDGDTSDHIDIISLSLGGRGSPDDPLSQAVDNATEVGVLSVIAAGNSGPDENTIGSPGVAQRALTVGASDKSDKIANFSSRGLLAHKLGSNSEIIKPNVLAPGVSICAAEYADYVSSKRCLDAKHVAISGTSMATPHISGVAALLKQLHPDWSPDDIKSAIVTTAKDIGESPKVQGTGRVDALNAASADLLINPVSLNFGLVSKSASNWTNTQTFRIKNTTNSTANMLARFKNNIQGGTGSIEPSIVVLNPQETKEIKVNLNIDTNKVPPGFFFNEIAIQKGSRVYRIPFLYFYQGIELTTEPKTTNGDFVAKVNIPGAIMPTVPKIQLVSPSGKRQDISFFNSATIFGVDQSQWVSDRITASETGVNKLSGSVTELPGVNLSYDLFVDKTSPTFQFGYNLQGNNLNISVQSSKKLKPSLLPRIIDGSSSTSLYYPSGFASGNNTYLVYCACNYGQDKKVLFKKSYDNGNTWSNSVLLKTFKYPDEGDEQVITAVTKYKDKIYVVFTNGSRVRLTSSSDEGENWSDPQTIATERVEIGNLITSIDSANGKLFVAYQNGTSNKVILLSSEDGINFSSQSVVSLPQGGVVSGLSLDFTDSNYKLVYTDYKQVHFLFSEDGINWKEIWSTSSNSADYPSMVSNGNNVYLVWSSQLTGKIKSAYSSDNGQNWLIRDNITGSANIDWIPHIALVKGRLYLTWLRDIFGGTFAKISDSQGQTWSSEIMLDNKSTFVGNMFSSADSVHMVWSTASFLGKPYFLNYTNDSQLNVSVKLNSQTSLVKMTSDDGARWSGKTNYLGDGDYEVNATGFDEAGNFGSAKTVIKLPASSTSPREFSVDLKSFKSKLGMKKGDSGYENRFDLNQDGIINLADLDKVAGIVGEKTTKNSVIIQFADFRNAFGSQKGDLKFRRIYDLDNSNQINITDFSFISSIASSDGANLTLEVSTFRGLFGKKASDPGFEAKYDLNKDGKIDVFDYSYISGLVGDKDDTLNTLTVLVNEFKKYFGSMQGKDNFNRDYDINEDGQINITDFTLLSSLSI